MFALHAHPDSPPRAAEDVVVEAAIIGGSFELTYRIGGPIEQLYVPQTPLDPERLWEHTCGELFVAPRGGEEYLEWNFSPTGQAACFEFEAYRRRRDSKRTPDAEVITTRQAGALLVQVRVPLPSDLTEAARLSFTAVVEDSAGGISYWASAHPAQRPDFHHRDGFTLGLTLTPAPAIVVASA